ncbi:endothelin-1 [Betta splendens]|uniref:Endothelin-1 n=1 Tax=Betta splendens TaxID=158456 RepID=A0A6P7NVP9_BETSP|nr:endothelin-1 [Betta splendens]
MDIYVLISVLSLMYSWMLCTVRAAPAAHTTAAPAVTQRRHVRTKRCSCATFLDKECVYFCHLDIIWVNTPERVVSYGMGDAPRTRRAAPGSMATRSGARCRCAREDDAACSSFCLERDLRYETPTDSAEGDGCAGAQCKHELAADTGASTRLKGSEQLLKAALKTRLLLETWRARRPPKDGR